MRFSSFTASYGFYGFIPAYPVKVKIYQELVLASHLDPGWSGIHSQFGGEHPSGWALSGELTGNLPKVSHNGP